MRNILGWLIIASLPLLSGCVLALLGGAAATGVIVAEDRRTVGTVTEDQGIEAKAATRLGERLGNAHFNVTSVNRMVLLTGEVPTAAAREDAERVARGVENVRGIFNELQVGANSAMSVRTNDSYLTSTVKTRLVNTKGVSSVNVKVVTESSVVYLMGLVNRAEAEAATEATRTTNGVQKVVRLFEYLD